MGDPYLSSNESLILSTHNICIDGVSLDLMLTSRRLILIDNSVTPFNLHTIPLETIITVVAGTDAKGDPIITLSCMDPSGSGAPYPVDFIFTRQKGEPRVKECSEWAASLGTLAAGARDGALSTGTLPYDPLKVIRPRMSATYGIETFSPRKPVLGEYTARAEPVKAAAEIPAGVQEPVPPETPEIPETSDTIARSSHEPVEPVSPGTEEPVSPLPDKIPEAEEIPESSNPEEPASPSPEEIIATEEIPESSGNGEPVTPAPEEIIAAEEIPESSGTEEAVSPSPEEISVAEEMPVRSGTEDLVNPSPEEIACAEEIPGCSGTDEPATSSPEEITVAEEIPGNSGTEEPVSSPPAMTMGEASPAVNDTARIWAEAVRTAIAPSPAIPPVMVPEPVPAAEPVTGEPAGEDAGTDSTVALKPAAEEKEEMRPLEVPGSHPPADDKPAERTLSEMPPAPSSPLPPAPEDRKSSGPPYLIAALVVIVLVVLAGAAVVSFFPGDSAGPSLPVITPAVTVPLTPTPLPTTVPADGVWVRIDYPGTFIGEVGNPGLMHPVSGTGVRLYKVLWSDRIVQASAQKQENSGETLVLEVYNQGTLIKRTSTRAPRGSVSILIDPLTGRPPGMTAGDIP